MPPIEENDIRSDLEAAFDKADQAEAAAAPAAEPVVEATEKAAPATDGQPATQEITAAEVTEAGRVRDEKGRFQKTTEKSTTSPDAAAAPAAPASTASGSPGEPGETAQAAAQPQQSTVKAPASWKPEEKAHWEAVPPAAREAVMRRETEINRALAEASTSRRAVAALQDSIAPYMNNIRVAAGGDVVGAIKTFFDYDNTLRHGTQIEKARALTRLIKGYGVDISALDNELAGEAPTPEHAQQSSIQQLLARELAPLREMMSRQQQEFAARQQQSAAALEQTIDQFAADPKNKHFNDVADTMADLLEVAERQGRALSLADAYDAACWQTPEVRSILIREQTAQATGTVTQAAQRAKAAAVSVRSGPRSTAVTDADAASRSRTDDIAAAFDKHAATG